MSPILVRPVREQLEHDRIIRQLQAKFRRKYEAGINPGAEQNSPVSGAGPAPMFPDVVLLSPDRGHKLQGVIEGDQVRFTMVFRNKEAPPAPVRVKAAPHPVTPHVAEPRTATARSGGSRAAASRASAPPKRKSVPRAAKAKQGKPTVKRKSK